MGCTVVCTYLQSTEKALASTFAMSPSTLRRSHPRGPGLVEERHIVSHQVEDFAGVRANGTRALEVALAAEFVSEQPPHSAADEPAFGPEDDVSEVNHSAGRPDARLC